MSRILKGTRYLTLLPILGLAIAAAFFFVFGGIGLIRLLFDLLLHAIGAARAGEHLDKDLLIVEVVEYVHLFLVGTVLFITSLGLYQLFIEEVDFVGWLKIESTEELETNLIGVAVVVLAVNFMGEIITRSSEDVLQSGAGIALPIAALGLFIGLRAWAARSAGSNSAGERDQRRPSAGQDRQAVPDDNRAVAPLTAGASGEHEPSGASEGTG
jgi:uncharacterized membrane protein YqhA